ncbi:uncharacterized protein LOC134180533 [Corticium candelabrum]|uniref:uncharacterized protein LOC134180533 n=1 Tax=Corticium candelabrum TaxID=121492 RepID=UPI002E2570CA|nr:uncharacterized protein LOC134180533 [Corticium candelabrum]
MKALILAAGYGTRLEKDIDADESGKFFSLVGIPKPLLLVGGVALVSRWIRLLEAAGVTEIIVVTNDKYFDQFSKWSVDFENVKLLNNGTRSNEDRLGAIGDIHFAIQEQTINDDLVIVGGDTLFFEDFDLRDLIEKFEVRKREDSGSFGGVVLRYVCSDDETTRRGILEIDKSERVIDFLEKPLPRMTSSRNACPCFYLLSQHGHSLIGQFLDERRDRPLREKDAPGNLVLYVCQRLAMFAVEISGRFDVGCLSSYVECDRYFTSKENKI